MMAPTNGNRKELKIPDTVAINAIRLDGLKPYIVPQLSSSPWQPSWISARVMRDVLKKMLDIITGPLAQC